MRETKENISNLLLRTAMSAIVLKSETITFRQVDPAMIRKVRYHARLSFLDALTQKSSLRSASYPILRTVNSPPCILYTGGKRVGT